MGALGEPLGLLVHGGLEGANHRVQSGVGGVSGGQELWPVGPRLGQGGALKSRWERSVEEVD